MLATGSADKSVGIWDLRNIDKKIHSLQSHRSDVIGLQWHPQDAAILASSSYDRRVLLWDFSKIGSEQTEEEQEDGPPELYVIPNTCPAPVLTFHRLFMHGGFTNRICDFDWNKNDPWLMMGAAEDNQLQIFRPARKLVEPLNKTVNHGEVSD